jgi:hypothetical protein
MRLISTLLIVLSSSQIALGQAPAQERHLRFSYKLTSPSRTSAGVFDSGGTLIRTLWSNDPQTAGDHVGDWDGKNDEGKNLPVAKDWIIKVLSSNVTYKWDGVIGNTEFAWTTSSDIWDGLGYMPTQMKFAFYGDKIWASTGYSEGTINLLTFNSTAPNHPTAADKRFASQNVQFVDIDSDGQFLYMPNVAVWGGENFVTKFNAVSGQPAAFTQGQKIAFPYSWKKIDMSGIDIAPAKTPPPTAVAVQDEGAILAVAHKAADSIRFFDKRSGLKYGEDLSIPAPESIAFTSRGLWVLSKGHIFLVSSPGDKNKLSQPIKQLSNPVYVASNKANDHIFILDGGTSQQVKEYDGTYRLVRTYGDIGGYTDWDPTITNRKLMLDNTATKGIGSSNKSWIRVSPNNDLWICDGGNLGRILHISRSNVYIDRILFSQETYALAVSQSVPTRLFRGLIEYKIDYSKPLMPGDPDPNLGGNGAWEMIKNWAVGAEGAHGSAPAEYSKLSAKSGVLYVEKLRNGATYGQLRAYGSKLVSEVEFPADGHTPLRFTDWKSNENLPMQQSGDLLKFVTTRSLTKSTLSILRSSLLRFDGSGNPVRGPFIEVAHAQYDPSNEPGLENGWGMSSLGQPTISGIYPVYSTQPFGGNPSASKPHLAGMNAGKSAYVFETNREKCIDVPDLKGGWPCKKSFGGHNGIGAQAIGNNIFSTYDGQYAKYGGQTYHYWTDGLMVGQFGQSVFSNSNGMKPAGSAGNIATTRFVQAGQNIYMYMTAEAGYTPIQRWQISNLSSIQEQTGKGKLGSEVSLR